MTLDTGTLASLPLQKREPLSKNSESSRAVKTAAPAPKNTATEDSAQIGSRAAKEAYRKLRRDVVAQANSATLLANEKSALLDSAQTVNKQQLQSARRLQELLAIRAPTESVARERRKFHNLEEIGQEVEEDIVIHNIESRAEQSQPVGLGHKAGAVFQLNPVNYRVVDGEMDDMPGIERTIVRLKDNGEQLRSQNNELRSLRSTVKKTATAVLAELDEFADSAIRSVAEAQFTARSIVSLMDGGGLLFAAAHGGLDNSNTAINLLQEED